MIEYLSNQLTNYLCKKHIIEENEKDIYVYGYQILIASAIGVISALLIGALLHQFLASVIFLVVFIWTRQYCGGYHANSFLSCLLSFILTYTGFILILQFLTENISFIYTIFMLLIYLLTIYKYAPIEHPNKPASQALRKKNRLKSLVLSVLWISLVIMFHFIYPLISMVISLSLFLIAILMYIEIIQKEDAYDEQ